jgi:glycosyltransferase involved in cell wall biosynthesis
MQRIAYLCLSEGWGGLEMNQLRNAEQMRQRGHEVIVIANRESPITNAAQQINIPVHIVVQKPKHYQWLFAYRLSRFLQKEGYRTLFFRNNRELSIAASVRFFSFGKVGVHYFMEMALGGNKTQFFRTLRYLWINSWVCPLPYLVAQVKQQTKIAEHKIKHIHSGISLEKKVELSQLDARKQLGLPLEQKIWLVVGRVDPKKQQGFIWNCFKERNSDKELLVFVGDPTPDENANYQTTLRQQIEEHPKKYQVRWVGFQQNMIPYYRAADLVLMAANLETVGMVTLEALQNNCPVVGAGNGGTKELIDTYGGGACFTSLNVASLNSTVNKVLNKDYPTLNRDLFEQHFDFNNVCAQVETEVLGLHAPIFL